MNHLKATRRILQLFAFSAILFATSCVKNIDEYKATNTPTATVTDILDMKVPSTFKFNTENTYDINITLLSNDNMPLHGVPVKLMTDAPENNGKILYSGITDLTGKLIGKVSLPTSTTQIIVNTNYIGIVNNAIASVGAPTISMILGGKTPQRIKTATSRLYAASTANFKTASIPNIVYLGSWNGAGKPNYLSGTRDNISADFLSRINTALPEYTNAPVAHPEYFDANTNTNVEITQTADVWMTFVHEGAGYQNSVGYYLYNKNNPPQSASDINAINIVFPNMSYAGSGGDLVSGDKVYLGNFGPDTIVGLVLLSNAYNTSTQTVGNGYYQYYSNAALNPESSSSHQMHNVALWDSIEQRMVIGFEDLNRDQQSDDDFNDAIFYITTSPSSSISSNRCIHLTPPVDTDGDGVPDIYDDYPTDPNLATNNYYPSSTTYAHIAFEDLWPFRGDYDMNDLLVGYRFNIIKDANNMVHEIQAKVYVNAAGGSYANGFGFELPVTPSVVDQVSGTRLLENYISLNGNGTEAGQTNAVVIAFDNDGNLAHRVPGYYINTEPGSPVITSDTIRIAVRFNTPQTAATIGTAPFNPFMISNKRRGYEIHLADHPPTSLADQSLFNTGQDRTNAALGRYYKSDKGIPWALNIPADFPIIKEKTQIINAYLMFQNWAQSGGATYTDWYMDKPGYRNVNNLLFR